ncbi:homocysteine S-methyltransferase family protein, partial [Rhodococcus qingshengii]|uniref:homocysteine S-methyltransferase family protein n=1 Tax=Rhodococcus qingshengii TaxID=334542 RepID=UPI003FEF81DD
MSLSTSGRVSLRISLHPLEPLGIDMIGLNCATGPAEMSEHLRHLSKYSTLPVSVMPNAG